MLAPSVVSKAKFNRPAGEADSWVYVYDADTLVELAKHRVPEVVHGAGGMAWRDGRFFIVGGLSGVMFAAVPFDQMPALSMMLKGTAMVPVVSVVPHAPVPR